jgi:hypothetical protein
MWVLIQGCWVTLVVLMGSSLEQQWCTGTILEGSSPLWITVPMLRTDVSVCEFTDTHSWASTAGWFCALSELSTWEAFVLSPGKSFSEGWLAKGLIFNKSSPPPYPGARFEILYLYPPVLLKVQYQFGCDHNLSFTPNEHHYQQDVATATHLSESWHESLAPEEVNHHQHRLSPVSLRTKDFYLLKIKRRLCPSWDQRRRKPGGLTSFPRPSLAKVVLCNFSPPWLFQRSRNMTVESDASHIVKMSTRG